MFHHDEREYQVAKSQAAQRGREKLQGVIDKGRASAQAVIEQVQSRVITDRVVRTPAVELNYDDEGDRTLRVGGFSYELHEHAYRQVLENAGVTYKYVEHLTKEAGGELWGKKLAAQNVNEILSHREKQRNLVRGEGETGLVKGFLSDRFRRLDSRPVADAFIVACQNLGMVPIEGVASDTKMRIRAVLPYVFEPIADEVMIFGAELGNSDYGDGGLVVNLWTMRIWCTNLAVAEKCLRQVHLGGRLPDNVRFSDETYRKDAETMALAVRDVTADAVGPDRVHKMLAAIEAAGEDEVKGTDGIDKILGRLLDKNELSTVKTIYESPDVVNLPAGETVWRLSNAVSWFAQGKSVTPDRKLALQELAGTMVAGETKKVKEV
jgi:hypothetical protein